MDFLKNWKIYLIISIVLALFSILILVFWKLNLSIDMTWGINMEYSYENEVDIVEIREELTNLASKLTFEWRNVINSVSVYSITWEKSFSVVAWFDSSIEEQELNKLKLAFRDDTLDLLISKDSSIIESKYVNIWKTFWDYIKNTALLSLAIASVAITIYIAYAFSWVVSWISVSSFALITILTLIHDVLISAWIYVLIGFIFKNFLVDTYFVTALLTILGYSINNTIVIFDRVRLNLREYAGKWKKWKDAYEIINMSVAATIRRSIYTSLTLFFVLISVFILWPEGLRWFIFVMILWVIIGTFSSVLVAPYLLYTINKNKKLVEYREKVERVEDKYVV